MPDKRTRVCDPDVFHFFRRLDWRGIVASFMRGTGLDGGHESSLINGFLSQWEEGNITGLESRRPVFVY